MAATIARPPQALRRRDQPRPTLAKRQQTMDVNGDQANKKRKLEEPCVRTPQHVLRKFNGKPPSLIIHLHPTHFKFEGQDGSFSYDSEMKFILEHLKRKTVPHQMMQELLENGVQFYDGCLIVEVHNYRTKDGKDKRHDSATDDDTVKFSMHNYTEHITPSPFVPFPSKARTDDTPEKPDNRSTEMPAPERPKEKEGPRIFTTVLFPTDLSLHHEMLILANTPASEIRTKKRGSADNATPSSAHPQTPSLSVPPTPVTQTARGSSSQSQKTCLEPDEFYSFQSDILVTTGMPLYLEPVDNPQDAQKVLDMLQHPLHQEAPPSPKTRKRTTAELAADDAQKQETERRMLIMDERIKPSGTGTAANEGQAAASALTFSKFKTLDMVRQKLEEQERLKKEEEFRAAAEKKQAEEQSVLQKQAALAQRQREMQMMAQQQPNQQTMLLQQQRQAQMRERAIAQAQQQAQLNQNHAHPQQNAMMQNQAQNFAQANQASMQQSSPIVRQQTPMMNSSPMMNQGSFPVNQPVSSAAAAGSPPRPTSATMAHPMARQASQQQQGSRGATPQIAQATPSMAQAVPNRQMTQTPRMPPGSPAPGMQQGTPTSASMTMQTPHMNNQNFTPEQMAMIQQQQQRMAQGQQGGAQAGSPQNMTPEQIQSIQNMQNMQRRQAQSQMQRNAMMQAQAAAQGNPQMMAQLQAQKQQMVLQQQQRQQQMLQAQQSAQMHGSPAQHAGSPGGMLQQTPQMNHAHPQQQGNMQEQGGQMTPQQQQQVAQAQARATHLAQMRANAQQQQAQQARQLLQPLIAQYGTLQAIPRDVIQRLPPQAQQLLNQQYSQNQIRQQQAMRAQQQVQQQGSGEQVPGSQPNPHYMQQLRNNQAALQAHQAQMQQNQQQGGGMNGMQGMSFHMNGMGQNFGNQQGQGGGDNLSAQFAAMQNVLNQQNQQRGGGGQGMQ